MPRKSTGSTSVKRDRSASSDLSEEPKPAPKIVATTKSNNGTPTRPARASKAASVAKNAAAMKAEEESEDEQPVVKKPRASKGAQAGKGKAKKEIESDESEMSEEIEEKVEKVKAKPKAKVKAKPKAKAAEAGEGGEVEEKPKKKPKAKAFPPPDLEASTHPARQGHPVFPLAQLTVPPNGGVGETGLNSQRPMLLGAHVSMAGGPAAALLRASKAGANGLALFLKSQRTWKSSPYEDEAIERFRDLMKPIDQGGMGYGPESILVHGSYLINLGNPDPVKWAQAYDCFKDDIYRCHQLGLKLYNWHPGSTVGACTREESYASIAKAINMVHKDVPDVVCVIENMANAGSNIIGTTFHDLSSIIALVEDKTRVRVCLDTCHLFAAGYDIRTPESYANVMKEFDEKVGNGYLAGIHLNDSKMGLGEKKDLHENIGLGKIGLSGFRQLMRDPLMSGIPLVLETPAAENPLEVGELAIWVKEITLLYQIQAIPDDEWAEKEETIREEWRKVRDVMNPPKEKKVAAGKKGKGKAKKGDDEDEDDE